MMTWTPLASSWAKLHRASKHLDALDKKLVALFDPKGNPVVIEVKVNGTKHSLMSPEFPTSENAA